MRRSYTNQVFPILLMVLLTVQLATAIKAQPDSSKIIPAKVPPGITATTVKDPRYGPDVEHTQWSDDKFRVLFEYWKDAAGNIMETHSISLSNDGTPFREYWSFRNNKKSISATHYWYDHERKEFTDNLATRIRKATVSDVRQWLDRIEGHFVKTGNLDVDYQAAPPKPEPPKNPVKSASMTANIDPCVVGKWVATVVEDLGKYKFFGGTGFTVSISPDGTQTVDYSNMQPFTKISESFKYEGIAVGKISALSGIATIERIERAGVKQIATLVVTGSQSFMLKNMGPGALGSTANSNDYLCTETNLTYKTSWLLDGRPTHQVVLTRRK